MARLQFAHQAREDRRALIQTTVDRWGSGQARRFRRRLEDTLRTLVHAPGIGHRRPDLDPPGARLRYVTLMGWLMIVYAETPDGIVVLRLLHGARDIRRILRKRLPPLGGAAEENS